VVVHGSYLQVLPSHRFRPRYLGEDTVYQLISKLEDTSGFAVHSVNLPEHEYKRWSEADFVIVCRRGVFLLEVKGGTVRYSSRVWRYENARGEAIVSAEGPARQALSAAIALERLLEKATGERIKCRWGVVFPLCQFEVKLPELPEERLADHATCASPEKFSAWLDSIPQEGAGVCSTALSDERMDAIRQCLVPEFSATIALSKAFHGTAERVARLTGQQFMILESLGSNPRLCVTGGAGTGKTELAILCAIAEKQDGRRPVVVCSDGPFFRHVRERLGRHSIPVSTGWLPDGTDTLIVDEGQDFAQPDVLERLFSRLPGGIENGRWRWFMDPNLQFTERPPSTTCIDYLARNSTAVRLTRNVRTTREVVECTRALLEADLGVSDVDGYGMRVHFHAVRSKVEEAAKAEEIVSGLLGEGFEPREIAVLGGGAGRGSTCRALLSRLRSVLAPIEDIDGFPSATHGAVGSIRSFRGLESPIVLLVDLDEMPEGETGKSILYTGMTRSTALLHMLTPPETGRYLKSLLRQ